MEQKHVLLFFLYICNCKLFNFLDYPNSGVVNIHEIADVINA